MVRNVVRMLVTRRSLMCTVPVLAGVALAGPGRAADDPIAAIERRHGGRLGVFALDTGSGRTLAHRADERFMMCSTFKGILAALVLLRVDAGQERLARFVRYGSADLKAAGYPDFFSDVTAAHLSRGGMDVGALAQAIVEVSDNCGAVLLMRDTGGPAGLTRFVRSLGDTVTRSDRYEPYSNTPDAIRDTTTPRAIALLVRTILLGDVLRPSSRALLEGWMVAAPSGRRRLRAAFPTDWVAGDKTGTGGGGECNDYALVRPPGRAPLLVAAYYDAPASLPMHVREGVLREVGGAFVRWAG